VKTRKVSLINEIKRNCQFIIHAKDYIKPAYTNHKEKKDVESIQTAAVLIANVECIARTKITSLEEFLKNLCKRG
jgi:hypothetical protein